MDYLSTKIGKNSQFKFYCIKCDYGCSKQSHYNQHILTRKHKNQQTATNSNDIMTKGPMVCEYCNKTYKDRSGLWRHQKKCKNKVQYENKLEDVSGITSEIVVENDGNLKNAFIELIQENKEIRKIMVNQQEQMKDQQEQMKEIIPKIGNNNNNTINNKYNMNIFLNEHCKDAINIMDFVKSLKLKLEDLENTAKVGYIDGISQVFINGLQDLDVTKRPIHCTDLQQEILYVKDKNNWEKDDNNRKIKKAISSIGKSNAMLVPEWVNNNPEYIDSNKEIYWKIVDNTIVTDENKKIDQIIKNVAKEVIIDDEEEEYEDNEEIIDKSKDIDF